MTDEESEKPVLFREILVAIDTSKHSQAALDAAVALARTMEANIRGMFVQDEMWARISRLPSITAVNTLTGQVLPLKDETLESQVTVLNNRLRQKLEQVSRRNRITHSWHFTTGKVDEKILEAAKEADLITIGLKGSSVRKKTLGSSARRIIEEADKPVLILKEGLHLGTTLTAIYDGSEESRHGIEIALQIAEKNESTLTVLVLNKGEKDPQERKKDLEKLLHDSPVFVELEQEDRIGVSHFLNTVNKQKCGLLIIPKNQPLLTNSLQIILNHINCPLLMANKKRNSSGKENLA